MTAARRLAAILAVDVVGYSRLMGEDEAGTAERVRAHREAARPIVAGLGGRVVKTMGDGLLLEFPSVVAAVECAIALQTLMAERNAGTPEAKRIVYRIGVNLGDVLVEGDDILGDGVNIAARLEALCEPGGVLISGTAHDHVRGRIEAEFVDLGEQTLKKIARPVRAYAVKIGGPAPARAIEPKRQGPPRLSLVVVLPFANIGGDASQDYFVDGVTESLTTDLSRIAGAFVIGRSTAFTYKGKGVDLKQLGCELNVRYVLEGSVQRGGNRMRVNVQLIEAETGVHLWAERFDKPVADLFDMQDEIVSRLANQLRAELVAAEARRAEQTINPDSLDLCFQGHALLNRGRSPDLLVRARGFFERALELDADNVEALSGAANIDFFEGASYSIDDPRPLMAAAEAKLLRALAGAPNYAGAHAMLGYVFGLTNRVPRAIEEFDQALSLDPNHARAHAGRGVALAWGGRAEETEAHVLGALRLSPRDALLPMWCLHAGAAKVYLGKDEEALPWLRRSIDADRKNPLPFFYISACLACLGRIDEAGEELRGGLAISPNFTLKRFRTARQTGNARFMTQLERVIDGLRLAGAPEE